MNSGQWTTDLLDELRTAQISHLLVAAVTEFDIGETLAGGGQTFDELRAALGLDERPAIVLLTALRSIGLIDVDAVGRLELTAYGRDKLDPSSPLNLRGYIGLGALSADVQAMMSCLKNDRPAGDVSFVYFDGRPSALDEPATADLLTRAMACRARNVAPALATKLDLSRASHLVDVGGAHGLYSIALLKRFPNLRATIIDRAVPLNVAAEYAREAGVYERVTLQHDDAHTASPGDPCDVVLLANLLHDYDADVAERLVAHYAEQVSPGGRVMVLDSLLDSVDVGQPPVSRGPRAVAAYSAMLFTICEGRCYRRDEVETWFSKAGLQVDSIAARLPAHGSVVTGWKE